jgi:hypothetical protein
VYEVVQLPDDNVHEDGLNVPPALVSFHTTVPEILVVELEVSETVAVSVTCDP